MNSHTLASPAPAMTMLVEGATRDCSGGLVINSKLQPGMPRQDLERRLYPSIVVGLFGWQRAHSQGPGLGAESQHGIRYAPADVNQHCQRLGIERHLRELHPRADLEAEGDPVQGAGRSWRDEAPALRGQHRHLRQPRSTAHHRAGDAVRALRVKRRCARESGDRCAAPGSAGAGEAQLCRTWIRRRWRGPAVLHLIRRRRRAARLQGASRVARTATAAAALWPAGRSFG
jgi:hypothetical protein